MALELWLAFIPAAAIMLVIPGPTITLVLAYALAEGRRSALYVAAGVALGDLAAMTLSLMGVGALLAASAELFTILKLIGAAYLIWLGIRLWRAPVESAGAAATSTEPRAGRAMALHAFAVTALNPKSIAFFVAFVPQFMDSQTAFWPQASILIATFVTLATLNALGYALLASHARNFIRRPAVQRWINRLGGSVLIGAGVVTATLRPAA